MNLQQKLFLSYLIVIFFMGLAVILGAIVLAPGFFAEHIELMIGIGESLPSESEVLLTEDLYSSFNRALLSSLLVSMALAILAAIIVSALLAKNIVRPIQKIVKATQRIAKGRYEERVLVSTKDELGELGHNFNEMAQALFETEKKRVQLMADVAHEMRTPLMGIKGNMEGLLDEVIEPAPEVYRRVYRDSSRLTRLVEDLNELSKAEAKQIPLKPEKIDILELIKEAVEQVEPLYATKGVKIKIEGKSTFIYVDADRIIQVLINLLRNSLQYTAADGLVSVHTEKRLIGTCYPELDSIGDMLWISVADNGKGIATQHLPYVFDRFYRVDRSRVRSEGGTGLGLTIAKYLVLAHDGDIVICSEENRGTTVAFSLPKKF